MKLEVTFWDKLNKSKSVGKNDMGVPTTRYMDEAHVLIPLQ